MRKKSITYTYECIFIFVFVLVLTLCKDRKTVHCLIPFHDSLLVSYCIIIQGVDRENCMPPLGLYEDTTWIYIYSIAPSIRKNAAMFLFTIERYAQKFSKFFLLFMSYYPSHIVMRYAMIFMFRRERSLYARYNFIFTIALFICMDIAQFVPNANAFLF